MYKTNKSTLVFGQYYPPANESLVVISFLNNRLPRRLPIHYKTILSVGAYIGYIRAKNVYGTFDCIS